MREEGAARTDSLDNFQTLSESEVRRVRLVLQSVENQHIQPFEQRQLSSGMWLTSVQNATSLIRKPSTGSPAVQEANRCTR